MPFLRTNAPDVFEARMAELIFKAYTMDPLRYTEIFNISPSTKAYEDAFEFAGLGTFQLKPEGQPIAYSDPVQGPRRRVVHSTFALGFRVTMEAEADAQYDVIDQQPTDLGDSARDHQETQNFAVLNDAFDGNTHTGMDGLSLINTAHTTLRAEVGTQSNEISPGVALSVSGMETALTRMRTTVSDEGRQVGSTITPKWLVVPPDLEHVAATILETERGRPGTSDHDINTVRTSKTGVSDFVSPFLTDVDNWFLAAGKNKQKVTVYNRAELTTDSGVDSQSKDRLHDAFYRQSVAIRGWRGWVGSQV